MGFRDLKVYQLAFKLAMEIFEITKTFPPEEKYSLTDQIRSHHVQFVQILEKHTEKEDTRSILSAN